MTAPTFAIAGHMLEAPPLDPGLYLVATPIGNLRDITIRALETLAACDLLACEDTRITRRLLERYAIARKPVTYHEHNAAEAGARLLAALDEGRSVALVSDAGTPLISDPGYRLVQAARAAGHAVVPIPGASSVMAALVASGLPTDDIRFIGFLPAKDKARHALLESIADTVSTIVAFESPKRLASTLKAVTEVMGGDRTIGVARELTKRFEAIISGNVREISEHFGSETIKGEIVLLIAPNDSAAKQIGENELSALLADLSASLPAAQAAREAARRTGLPRADLYRRLLAMKAVDG